MRLRRTKTSGVARPDLVFLDYIRHENEKYLHDLSLNEPDLLNDRLLGCMLGLAVGDVYGCPVEGMSYREIKKRYGRIDDLVTPTYWRNWRLPGLHSDDTQQALVVLIAIDRARTSDDKKNRTRRIVIELAQLYVEGLKLDSKSSFGCWRGTGQGFRNVVQRLERPKSSTNWPIGLGEPSAGLGAVMRIAPAGVMQSNSDFATLQQVVHGITNVSHTDSLASTAAFAIAAACQILKDSGPDKLDSSGFISTLVEQVRSFEENLHQRIPDKNDKKSSQMMSVLLEECQGLRVRDPNEAMRQLSQRTEQFVGRYLHPTAGFAPIGVAASMYFFLRFIDKPKEGLFTAISAGGDTDTIGAVVGSLFGTLYGPPAYQELLPEIVALNQIVRIVSSILRGESVDGRIVLIDEEGFWTDTENKFREIMERLA